MLIDRAVVEVRSGNGGNGAISFLREKNLPKGGPDGGNGGNGGSIYFVAKKNINTLLAYRHGKAIIAKDGEKGDKKNRYGLSMPDIYCEVPVGTIVYLEDGMVPLADLSHDGDKVLAAKGGKGGRGNASFKTSRLRVPRVAENGHPGETKRVVLELKLLADAGLIGFPSVGKSTFLNVVSKANVPTADYPFTTLTPNLGVVTLPDKENQFILADMPGLIEGASKGKGLGFSFLRHIERCRVLVHMVSMSGERDPYDDYCKINEELKDYGASLENRPQIVVATKMDMDGASERKAIFDKKLGFASYPLSSLTHDGVNPLIQKIYETIQNTPEFPLFKKEDNPEFKLYVAKEEEEPFIIKRPSAHLFIIEGEKVLSQYNLINLSTDQGVAKLLSYLTKIGIDAALKEKGAVEGDTVRIGDFEFEYSE